MAIEDRQRLVDRNKGDAANWSNELRPLFLPDFLRGMKRENCRVFLYGNGRSVLTTEHTEGHRVFAVISLCSSASPVVLAFSGLRIMLRLSALSAERKATMAHEKTRYRLAHLQRAFLSI